mgnify:CR=1 FL=1
MASLPSLKSHIAQEHTLGVTRTLASELKNIILGGQDGLVNVFGLTLGVAAGTNDTKAILIAGLAGTFAESISMAAVAYTSTKASSHYYESEKERELREIHSVPTLERKEVRDIYAKKGFRGKLLADIVKHITSKKKVWLQTMMSEELGLTTNGHDHPLRSAIIVGASAVVGSLIPIVPFFFLSPAAAIPYVSVICTLALFAAGAASAKITVGSWWKRGIEMAVIGMAAAATGYVIGAWLGRAI